MEMWPHFRLLSASHFFSPDSELGEKNFSIFYERRRLFLQSSPVITVSGESARFGLIRAISFDGVKRPFSLLARDGHRGDGGGYPHRELWTDPPS